MVLPKISEMKHLSFCNKTEKMQHLIKTYIYNTDFDQVNFWMLKLYDYSPVTEMDNSFAAKARITNFPFT